MSEEAIKGLPVNSDDRGEYVVWDLREWDGDVETMNRINEAWVEVHSPDEKVGTISVFPDHVVIGGQVQDFISEGWNEAAQATGLEYLAIVADGLQGMAVQGQIDAPTVDMEVFEAVEPAADWMDEQV